MFELNRNLRHSRGHPNRPENDRALFYMGNNSVLLASVMIYKSFSSLTMLRVIYHASHSGSAFGFPRVFFFLQTMGHGGNEQPQS